MYLGIDYFMLNSRIYLFPSVTFYTHKGPLSHSQNAGHFQTVGIGLGPPVSPHPHWGDGAGEVMPHGGHHFSEMEGAE